MNKISRYRNEIMGFAAILVFVFHDWAYLFNKIPVLCEIEYFIKKTVDVGVNIFLLVSGMGLYYSYSRNANTISFYYRRIKRIIIPFIITLLCVCIIRKWNAIELIRIVFGYEFAFGTTTKFLWYFYAIVVLYFLFPIYYKMLDKYGNKFIIALLFLWFTFTFIFTRYVNESLSIFLNRIPIFILGTVINRTNIEFKEIKKTYLFIILFFSILLCWLTKINENNLILINSYYFIPYGLLTISFIYVVSILCDRFSILRKLLSYVGKYSFEFYCAQEIIINDSIYSLFNKSPAIYNIVIFVIEIVIAIIIYQVNNTVWKIVDKQDN